MEELTTPFQLFAWLHLQFFLTHFVLYSLFWVTGPHKWTSMIDK